MLERFKVSVEPDDLKKNRFMVVIRELARLAIVGIPVRGIGREMAEKMAEPIRWAFEYGYRARADSARRCLMGLSKLINEQVKLLSGIERRIDQLRGG